MVRPFSMSTQNPGIWCCRDSVVQCKTGRISQLLSVMFDELSLSLFRKINKVKMHSDRDIQLKPS